MIVITGSKGFIGQNFLKYLLEYSNEEIVTVGEKDAWDWIGLFNDWDRVSLILHQGAISNTTETNIDKLHAIISTGNDCDIDILILYCFQLLSKLRNN